MDLTRRAVMRLCGGVAAAYVGWERLGASPAYGARLALRRVTPADAVQLQVMMNACVVGAGAFHGACSTWTLRDCTIGGRNAPMTSTAA
jgi:hypothetical protein